MMVLLQYKRIDKEHVTGELLLQGESELFLDSFEGVSFSWMMHRFSDRLRLYPEASAVMHRTDRDGLVPHVLDATTTALLRRDPAATVKAMTVVVSMPALQPAAKDALPPVLVVGPPVLADAFGDRLFIRRRTGGALPEMECPGCGRWRTHTVDRSVAQQRLCCGPCDISLAIVLVDARWASVAVEELLELNAPKFFFPRAWNEGRNWITHEALKNKYRLYQEEKRTS